MVKGVSDNWRFERKYTLNLEEFLQFEKLLLTSNVVTLYPDRFINNCYFDNLSYSSLEDSIEGYAQRKKIRIRWYGPLFGRQKPRLEFKIKQNNSNKKELFKLPEVSITDCFDWDHYLKETQDYLLNEFDFHLSSNIQPALINRYQRSYFTDFHKSYRLTIDQKLTFYSPKGTLKNKLPYKSDIFIIELKFDNSSIISNFLLNKNLGKFSKYSTGIMLIH